MSKTFQLATSALVAILAISLLYFMTTGFSSVSITGYVVGSFCEDDEQCSGSQTCVKNVCLSQRNYELFSNFSSKTQSIECPAGPIGRPYCVYKVGSDKGLLIQDEIVSKYGHCITLGKIIGHCE